MIEELEEQWEQLWLLKEENLEINLVTEHMGEVKRKGIKVLLKVVDHMIGKDREILESGKNFLFQRHQS